MDIPSFLQKKKLKGELRSVKQNEEVIGVSIVEQRLSAMGRVLREQDMPRREINVPTLPPGYYQGKPVYTTQMRFEDVAKYAKTYPDVQRKVDPVRVEEIKELMLEITEAGSVKLINDVIHVTARKVIPVYNATNGVVTFDLERADLSINDGSHRVHGVKGALERLYQDYINASPEDEGIRREKFNKLQNKVFTVKLYTGLNIEQEKQLFVSLNKGQKEVAKSRQASLDMTSPFNKLTKDVAELEFMKQLGVYVDRDRAPKGFAFSFNNLKQMISLALVNEVTPRDSAFRRDYVSSFSMLETVFELLFDGSDPIIPLRQLNNRAYWFSSPSALKGIGKYIYWLQDKYPNGWKPYVKALRNLDWRKFDGTDPNSIWRDVKSRGGLTTIVEIFEVLVRENHI